MASLTATGHRDTETQRHREDNTTIFDAWLDRWLLRPDGTPIATATSDLLPVRRDGAALILKIARTEEERRGAAVMCWYAGHGAARVFEHDGDAVLLERASGGASLVEMAQGGHDDDATRILCATIARLHETRPQSPPPSLVPLERWFRALDQMGRDSPPPLTHAQGMARELLRDPHDVVVLHGDIHHANVLHDAARGWLAVDPKGLLGDRAFDYANIFCNPDVNVAAAPGRLSRRVTIAAEAAGLGRSSILRWAFVYAALSAVWLLQENADPSLPLTVAQIALRELTT